MKKNEMNLIILCDIFSLVHISAIILKSLFHMTQQSHFWAYTPRKPDLKETRAPQCSSQHCLS